MLASTEVLTYYDPDKPVRIEADASQYGIGAVLSHVMNDGSHRPIAYVSRSLNKSERNYAQIDKEALGLVFAVEKFNYFIHGRKFTLVTDHKPLKHLLGPYSGIPHMAASRMQRWAIRMMKYEYDIEFRNTKDHANADSLSRLPLNNLEVNVNDPVSLFVLRQIEVLPVTANDIKQYTKKDEKLSIILDILTSGFDQQAVINDNLYLKPYLSRLNEMSIEQGCILWGNRVVIPARLQSKILEELHDGHCGIVAMKSIARSYIWWPGLDENIEALGKCCEQCLVVQNNPAKCKLHLWEWPSKRWERIHIDYAGPYKGWMYLVVVDAYTKWPEVILKKNIESKSTINSLRTLFAQHGLPDQIVSDNGSNFTSDEFESFCIGNGIKHKLTEPYNPQKNGEAERFVQTLKNRLEKMQEDPGEIQAKLDRFLLCYRNTPHSATNESPAMLLKGYQLKTKLDLIKPDVRKRVKNYQEKQISKGGGKVRKFEIGNKVIVRNYHQGRKWKQGIVVGKSSPYSFTVETDKGLCRRHLDQMLSDHTQSHEPVQHDHNHNLPDTDCSNEITEVVEDATPTIVNAELITDRSNEQLYTTPGNEIVPPSTPETISRSRIVPPSTPETISRSSRPTRISRAPKRLITEI